MGHGMTSSLRAAWLSRGVMGLLVRRDLAVKYQQSVLGYLWSLLEPLTIAATYWFIFAVLFDSGRVGPTGVPYLLFLASGLFAWIWVNGVLGEASTALTSQALLITTIRVAREVFAVGRVLAKFVEYLAAVPVLAIIALALGVKVGPTLLLLPVAVAMQAIFLVGVALALSSFNVLLRDVERFMRLIQRVLFYALPIVYPLALVTEAHSIPGWVKSIYQVNPLVGIVELHHAAWTGVVPPTRLVAVSAFGCLVVMVGGWWAFRRLEPAVLKEL